MLVGDRVSVVFTVEGKREARGAIVTYIHPQRRYYVAEAEIGGRKLRESFPLRPYNEKGVS